MHRLNQYAIFLEVQSSLSGQQDKTSEKSPKNVSPYPFCTTRSLQKSQQCAYLNVWI